MCLTTRAYQKVESNTTDFLKQTQAFTINNNGIFKLQENPNLLYNLIACNKQLKTDK